MKKFSGGKNDIFKIQETLYHTTEGLRIGTYSFPFLIKIPERSPASIIYRDGNSYA
jgi:hypothetical protein